jgi:hypothetical protein
VGVEGLLQRLGLHDVGVIAGAVCERVDPGGQRCFIAMDDEPDTGFGDDTLAMRVHVPELPGGVDMEQRKRHRRGVKRLSRQVQEHPRVLPD